MTLVVEQVVRSLGLGGGGVIETEDFIGKLMLASEATSVVARSERETLTLTPAPTPTPNP
eukprot:scaffold25752_cov36-Phaeocystis_antarctica.AAC.2